MAGHGGPQRIDDAYGIRLSPLELANKIKDHPKFANADAVQLASCNVGKGENSYAQQLANALAKPVVAPNNFVFFRANGSMYQADANPKTGGLVSGTTGVWMVFLPQGP